MEQNNERIAVRVSVITIIWNVVLSVIKLAAGLIGHSTAMISDAVHSASDVFSTVVVIIGAKLSAKNADKDHPYGHERFECVAAILLAVMLGLTGCGIGISAIEKIADGSYATAELPSMFALIAAIISIAIKEGMYWYTRAAAKKIHSGALMADAWHHRSDALSSIGSLIGIAGARMGILVLDSIAGIVICAFILKVAYDVFSDAVGKMTDRACDLDTIHEIRAYIMSVPGVRKIRDLKTRQFGERIFVDTNITVDASLTLIEGHDIARAVHMGVEETFPMVKHCMVHIGPYYPDEETTKAVDATITVAQASQAEEEDSVQKYQND